MKQHTKAPWTIETVPTAVGICHKIRPFDACIYVDSGGGKDPEEMEANARLMADAPDMYQWLQQIANTNCTCDNWEQVGGEINPAVHGLYCMYRLMILYKEASE